MKILILGDIYAGKTTIINELLLDHPNFEYISIDIIRNKTNNEQKAQKIFINEIEQNKNQIIEATGFGQEGKLLLKKLKNSENKLLVVILRTDYGIILSRKKLKPKNLNFTNYSKMLPRMIISVHKKLEQGELFSSWNNINNATILQIYNNSLKDKELIINLIKGYINNA